MGFTSVSEIVTMALVWQREDRVGYMVEGYDLRPIRDVLISPEFYVYKAAYIHHMRSAVWEEKPPARLVKGVLLARNPEEAMDMIEGCSKLRYIHGSGKSYDKPAVFFKICRRFSFLISVIIFL